MALILKEYVFDRVESCGKKSPVRVILEELEKMSPCEGVNVKLNDYDWVLTVKSLGELRGFNVEEEGKEDGFIKLKVYNPCQ
jgi:hypothetical protein